MTDELVTIGRIVKPRGIDVEVVRDGTPVRIASSRPHQGRLLVRFVDVADRTTAEGLRGAELHATPVDPEELDTYLVAELVGMAVVTPDGDHLGDVSDHVELPAAAGYDLLEVTREDGSTWLLPAVDEYVEVGELPDGTELLVVVDPPEGLVDGEPAVVRPDAPDAPDGADVDEGR